MTFACLAILQLAAIPISQARAAELSFADFPFLITCEAGGMQYAYYLSQNRPRRNCRLFDVYRPGGHDNTGQQAPTGGRRSNSEQLLGKDA